MRFITKLGDEKILKIVVVVSGGCCGGGGGGGGDDYNDDDEFSSVQFKNCCHPLCSPKHEQ
jgi:hypothetical protein